MKTLKFRSRWVDQILSGQKTATWRLFDDKNLAIGDELEFVNRETMEKFADAEIIGLYEKPLRTIEGRDFEGHETYESRDDMIREMIQFYGDKVTGDTMVKIVRFKLR